MSGDKRVVVVVAAAACVSIDAPCKLVDVYGYPEEIMDFEYDHTYMVRGLVAGDGAEPKLSSS